MESKTSSTDPRRRAGFSLPETLISMGIGGVVLAAVAASSFYTSRSMAALSNHAQLEQQSRQALDAMSWRIRSATRLTSYTTNKLVFDYNAGTLAYEWSPSTRRLTQNLNGSTTVLLEDCTALSFAVFQRSVVSNSFNQFAASGTNDAKAVVVKWTCAKKLLDLGNTESGHSARIVLRNNPGS